MMIREKIAKILKKEGNILFAYLFGSYARKEARKESDVDIAVFLKDPSIVENDPKFEIKLALKIERIIKRQVDIRVINDKSLTFTNQVLKHGKLLFSTDEKERINFETKMFGLYSDFRYFINEYNKKRFERYGIR
jgi:hypothetical protein